MDVDLGMDADLGMDVDLGTDASWCWGAQDAMEVVVLRLQASCRDVGESSIDQTALWARSNSRQPTALLIVRRQIMCERSRLERAAGGGELPASCSVPKKSSWTTAALLSCCVGLQHQKGLGSARRSASCIPPRLSPAGKELAGAIKNASWASSSPRFRSCQVKTLQMMIWAAAVSQPRASTSHTGTGMCGTGSAPGGHGCCCAKGKLKKK